MWNSWLLNYLAEKERIHETKEEKESSSSWRSSSSDDVNLAIKSQSLRDMKKVREKVMINEDRVQMALNFLSHPDIKGPPSKHIPFLQSKGLTSAEIQECFNRISSQDDQYVSEYDSIYILPPIKYEEFLHKLHTEEGERVLYSFQK